MVRPRTFFDFSIDGAPAGRVVFELFNDVVPKTVENFRALCTGELGNSKVSDGVALHYKGSTIHRSIVNFMIQGGDFTRHNGKGGESIYGSPFEDEDLTREVDAPGLLVMANKGPNTNGSQWFITLRPCPHLNGKHVVFGKVVFGQDTIDKITQVAVDEKDRPQQSITISHCGELELKKVPAAKTAPPARARSASVSSSESRDRKKKRRHRSPSASDAEDRKSRRKHRKDKDRSRKPKSPSPSKGPIPQEDADREETEAELDARLEREENERIAAEKQRKLEEIRQRAPIEEASNGVRYKGRGRMKFKDPETNLRGW